MHTINACPVSTAAPPDPEIGTTLHTAVAALCEALASVPAPVPLATAEIRAALVDTAELDKAADILAVALEQRRQPIATLIADLATLREDLNTQTDAVSRSHAEDVAAFAWLRRMVHDRVLDELTGTTTDHSRLIEEAFTAWGLPLARSFVVQMAATAHVTVAAGDPEQMWRAARQLVAGAVEPVRRAGFAVDGPHLCGFGPDAEDPTRARLTMVLNLGVEQIAASPYDAVYDVLARTAAQLEAVAEKAIVWTDVQATWMTDRPLPPDAVPVPQDLSHQVGVRREQTVEVRPALPGRPTGDIAHRLPALLRAWWKLATGTTRQRQERVAARLTEFAVSVHRRDRAVLAETIAAVGRASLDLVAARQAHQQFTAEAAGWERMVRDWFIQAISDGEICLDAANEVLVDCGLEPVRGSFTVVLDLPAVTSVSAVSPGEALLLAETAVLGRLDALLPGVDADDVIVLWDHADRRRPGGGVPDQFVAHLWLRVPVDVPATDTTDARSQAVAAVHARLGTVNGICVELDRTRLFTIQHGFDRPLGQNRE